MIRYVLVFIVLTVMSSCQSKSKSDCSNQITALEAQNDSLIRLGSQNYPTSNPWFDKDYEGQYILKKGIVDPERFIRDLLFSQPELIPLKSIMGGKMTFDRIELLGDKWLIAAYSDGHIEGRAFYEFIVNDSNEVEFKLLESTEF